MKTYAVRLLPDQDLMKELEIVNELASNIIEVNEEITLRDDKRIHWIFKGRL